MKTKTNIKRTSISMLLIVALLVTMAVPTFADIPSDNQKISMEEQTYRLFELQNLIKSSALVMPRDLYGLEIPNINLISTPSEYRQYFLIGLEIEHDLNYGDVELAEKITSQPVNEEIVDFILSFTGISNENAQIGYCIVMRTPGLFVECLDALRNAMPAICPVWGDDTTPEYMYEIDPFMVSGSTLRMGDRYTIQFPNGWLISTIGSPRNLSGTAFNASLHRTNVEVQNRNVFNSNGTIQIGRVTSASYFK